MIIAYCLTDQEAKKAIGNGWNEKTVRHIFSYMKEGEGR